MRFCLSTFLLLYLISSTSGQDVKLYEEAIGGGQYILWADNLSMLPYIVVVNMKLNNAKSEKGNKVELVLDANTKKREVTRIYAGKGRYSVGYDYDYKVGTTTKAYHDKNAVYILPFEPNMRPRVSQGYNGKLSHKGKKAIDFDVPSGTKIYAARSGKVLDVKQDSKYGCKNPSCISSANYINIQHDDGSIANYSHLQFNGVLVKLGQYVNAGDEIGISGSTGYSTLPHLHFEVFIPKENAEIGVETPFLIGTNLVYLGKK